ncbi:MAG: phosphoesterase, partial [Gammaproteobacteria bacterium]|nr:phosphoesterase [Gammaproteobacteria bacterium]
WDFFQKTAGESYVTKVDSFQTNAGSLLNNYMDSRSASSEKRQRIDLQDLKEQREGEAHIFFKSKIIRARMFFVDPPPAPKMRLNQFLKVESPLGRVLADLEDRIDQFREIISNGEAFKAPSDEGEEIQIISDAIVSQPDANSIERALGALLAFHNRHEAVEKVPEVEESLEEGKLNIFSKVNLDEMVKSIVGKSQFDKFAEPLINKSIARDKIELLERLMGRAPSQANPMTIEIIKDMSLATEYPPPVEGLLLPSEEVVAIANELCDYVISLKTKSQEQEV